MQTDPGTAGMLQHGTTTCNHFRAVRAADLLVSEHRNLIFLHETIISVEKNEHDVN